MLADRLKLENMHLSGYRLREDQLTIVNMTGVGSVCYKPKTRFKGRLLIEFLPGLARPTGRSPMRAVEPLSQFFARFARIRTSRAKGVWLTNDETAAIPVWNESRRRYQTRR